MTKEMSDHCDYLESFLSDYQRYLSGSYSRETLRTELQRSVPQISAIIKKYHGGGGITINKIHYNFYETLGYSLQSGASEHTYWNDIKGSTQRIINETIGNIESGLIPTEKVEPILPIKDEILKMRCLDLLNSPGAFDRVIRESTTVLEDRIKNLISQERLFTLIPTSSHLTGDKLITALLLPDNPVISVSNDQGERAAFYKMMLGICSYIRNPFHHSLDDNTEWSFAWSVVGLIDSLLAELKNAQIVDGQMTKSKKGKD